jgi:serine/threonine-protein phosphatase 2A regulatory subunit B''
LSGDDSFRLPVQKPAPVPLLAVSPLVISPKSEGGGVIPAFYFPQKKGGSGLDPEEVAVIDKLFPPVGGGTIKDSSELVEFVTCVLGVSRYFAEPFFRRLLKVSNHQGVRKSDVTAYWKGRLKIGDSTSNFFHIVRQDSCDYITRTDFRDFLWVLLDTHPGLSFLRDSPEFQERYADTVICRIFYHTDRRKVNKISLRDLRRSRSPSIVKAWRDLDVTEDINSVRLFFSYEHFYVLYCKFWDLDSDHDFLIDKDDLVKYDGHAWSPRAIDRVFSCMKFSSGIPGKMSYDDFVWFILSDEDKTSEVSLEFLFSLIDLDGDGVIRDHEMRFFYQDQQQRLECVNQDAPKLEDIVCQMSDLIKPDKEAQFTLSDFVRKRKQNAGVFFSILTSLNKFMHYEQRDPFQIKQDQLNNPEFSDWDKFCLSEYVRLAMEAGTNNNETQQQHQSVEGTAEEYLRNADGIGRR